MLVREAIPTDGARVVELLRTLFSETNFMLYEPGEFSTTEEQQARRIDEMARSDSGVMFLCEKDGQLIGAVFGTRGAARRTRHSLYVVIGVLQAWVGRGVGRALLQHLEEWALARRLHRLELTVAVDNARAISLYESFGFEREGVKRDSRRIEGRYSDELYMSKLLPP